MRLRRFFVRFFMALGQGFALLAVVLRWLAKMLEPTTATDARPESAELDAPPAPTGQPPEHWLAHTRREPPADWLEKVRQGAPQLLDPQFRPSRPPAPPPARSASRRPVADGSPSRPRSRPFKEVRFRSAELAANQANRQSPSGAAVSSASSSAKALFASPSSSPPDSAEGAEDDSPAPEGKSFPQAALAEPNTQPDQPPAIERPQPEQSVNEAANTLIVESPTTNAPAPIPAAREIKPPTDKAEAKTNRPQRRILFRSNPPQPVTPEPQPLAARFEERSEREPTAVSPVHPLARAFEEAEQQLDNAQAARLEALSAAAVDEAYVRPSSDAPITPPLSRSEPLQNPFPKRASARPSLAETAAPEQPVPTPPPYQLDNSPPRQRNAPGRIEPPQSWPSLEDGKSITADYWPALPNTFLDEAEREDDFYVEERRLRLDVEQRGPEWNE